MIKQKCKQCGREFELSDSEIKFYKDKGLSLPKRCEECRKANKAQKDGQQGGKKHGGKKAGAIAAAAILAAGIYASSVHKPIGTPPPEDGTPAVTQQAEGNAPSVQNTQAEENAPSVQDTQAEEVQNTAAADTQTPAETQYHFRSEKTLLSHFEKHGGEFGDAYSTPQEYEAGASRVINSPDALTKREKEDNDYVYYIEDSNEFVILSQDGYIRTYFKPNAGKKYYDRQ